MDSPQVTAEQVQQMITDAFTQRDIDNRYSITQIPYHVHNQTDSPAIDPNDLVNASLYFAVKQTMLTSAQILALHTTPITLVPKLGGLTTNTYLNAIYIVEGITAKLYYGGTAYTGANALEFRYTDASGAKVTADLPNTFINSGANAYAHVAGVTTTITPVTNTPIVVCVPTANPATGTGTMQITVKYRVITL